MKNRDVMYLILALSVMTLMFFAGPDQVLAVSGDSVLKGSITQLTKKVDKLSDIILVIGAVGAMVGLPMVTDLPTMTP